MPLGLVAVIFFGSALGAGLRYALNQGLTPLFWPVLPWATLVANGMGSFALGWVRSAANQGRKVSPLLIDGISVGLLAGLTTMSALAAEVWIFFMKGLYGLGLLYLLLSAFLGVGAAWLGLRLGEWGRPHPDSRKLAERLS